jgi:hypothetical protein
VGAVLVVIALLSGGFVVYRYVTRGGADSPEAAVKTLATAIGKQDPALAATVLDPDELPLLTDFLGEVTKLRSRLGGGNNGSPVTGLQTRISGLRVTARSLGSDASRVTVRSGHVVASVDPASLPPVGKSLLFNWNTHRARWTADVADLEDDFDHGLSLIAINRDGGWYVSPALSAADLLVGYRNSDLDAGDYGVLKSKEDFDDGASSAQDALDDLGDAIASGDPQKLLAALPSDEAQFGVVYGDAMEQFLKRYLSEGRLPKNWARLQDYDVKTEDGPDDTTRLVIHSARFEGPTDDPRRDQRPEDFEMRGLTVCQARESNCPLSAAAIDTPLGKAVSKALGGSVSLIARQVDGGWKIDPVASAFDLATRLTKAVNRQLVQAAVLGTNGTPSVTLTDAKKATVDFDANGYALLSAATTPGAPYVLQITTPRSKGDFSSPISMSWTAKRGSKGMGLGRVGRTTTASFVPDQAQTRIALGGVLNSASHAEVTLYKVPVEDRPASQPNSGTLTAPIMIERVALDGLPAGSRGKRTVDLQGAADGGDVDMSIQGALDLSPGENAYLDDGDTYLSLDKDGTADDVTDQIDGSTATVIITGDVGSTYSFRLAADTRGFQGGQQAGQVAVAAESNVSVPIDLGSTDTSFHVEVEWDAPVDIDQVLTIGSSEADNDSTSQYSGGDITLRGDGSGNAQIELSNLGQVDATVRLTITFDD